MHARGIARFPVVRPIASRAERDVRGTAARQRVERRARPPRAPHREHWTNPWTEAAIMSLLARIPPLERPRRQLAIARLGTALAATSLGALAVGAVAVGAMAIRKLAIRNARIQRLEIDELFVGGRRFQSPA
jgi:hypothetical protein